MTRPIALLILLCCSTLVVPSALPAAEWTQITSPDGAYQVSFPARPQGPITNSVKMPFGQQELVFYALEQADGQLVHVAGAMKYPASYLQTTPLDVVFRQIRDAVAEPHQASINETVKGEYLGYPIYDYTLLGSVGDDPIEILLRLVKAEQRIYRFAVAQIGGPVNRADAARFFGSVAFRNADPPRKARPTDVLDSITGKPERRSQWVLVESPDHLFSLEFPAQPRGPETSSLETAFGPARRTEFLLTEKGPGAPKYRAIQSVFTSQYVDRHGTKGILASQVEALWRDYGGTSIKTVQDDDFGFPAQRCTITGRRHGVDLVAHVWMALVEQRLYRLEVVSASGASTQPERFFDSFVISIEDPAPSDDEPPLMEEGPEPYTEMMVIHDDVRLRGGDGISKPVGLGQVLRIAEKDGEQMRIADGHLWIKAVDVMEIDEALTYFDTMIEQRPVARNYFRRALAKANLGRRQEALRDYTKAIELNPQDDAAWSNRGRLRTEEGDYQRAIQDHTRAIQINRQSPEAHDGRGVARYYQGDYPAAMTDFDQAIRLRPRYSSAYGNRGATQAALGNHDLAMQDYDRAIELDEGNAKALVNRGNAWQRSQKFARAIEDYDRAISIDENDAVAYGNRAVAYLQIRKYSAAHDDFLRATRLAPQVPRYHNDLAWLLATCPEADLRSGEFAVQYAQRACELTNHQNWQMLDTLAASYAEAGRFDDALATQQRALDLAPEAEQPGLRERAERYRDGKPFRQQEKDSIADR